MCFRDLCNPQSGGGEVRSVKELSNHHQERSRVFLGSLVHAGVSGAFLESSPIQEKRQECFRDFFQLTKRGGGAGAFQ